MAKAVVLWPPVHYRYKKLPGIPGSFNLSMSSLFSSQEAFFLQCPDGFGAYFKRNFLAIDCDGFGLQIRLPNTLGVALRKTHIIAVLLTFACDVALLHKNYPYC